MKTLKPLDVKVLDQVGTPFYQLYHGDCVEVARAIPSNSVHFTIYSPPFEGLFVYSNSDRDMGNSKDSKTFWEHYKFLIKEEFRVTMPGRLMAVHCMLIPTSKTHHGFIGLRDFRGEIIREHEKAGFIFHSEVTIWKDPVTAMQRTKALGLLHKQIKKDSCMSRQGVPDYLCVFRKPGANPERVTHTTDDLRVELWQRYASPVWASFEGEDENGFRIAVGKEMRAMSQSSADDSGVINPGDTLQRESAREHRDERHIAPLQLQVVERAVHLWSNPGDIVASWFTGIGTEGYQALKMGRRFIGTELKPSYYQQSKLNLAAAVEMREQKGLFDNISDAA